jgi:hypothetical protein
MDDVCTLPIGVQIGKPRKQAVRALPAVKGFVPWYNRREDVQVPVSATEEIGTERKWSQIDLLKEWKEVKFDTVTNRKIGVGQEQGRKRPSDKSSDQKHSRPPVP